MTMFQFFSGFGSTQNPLAIQAEGLLLLLIKFMFILGALIYVAFAGVVLRQIKIMRETLVTSFASTLSLLGWVHFLLAVGVFLLFFVIL